jgi:hypothetical protein
MNWPQVLRQDDSFDESKSYFLRISARDPNTPRLVKVSFIGYTTCPAVVVVQDEHSRRFPCERAALYTCYTFLPKIPGE